VAKLCQAIGQVPSFIFYGQRTKNEEYFDLLINEMVMDVLKDIIENSDLLEVMKASLQMVNMLIQNLHS